MERQRVISLKRFLIIIGKVRQKKTFLEGYSKVNSFVGKGTRAWSEAQRVVLL